MLLETYTRSKCPTIKKETVFSEPDYQLEARGNKPCCIIAMVQLPTTTTLSHAI